MTTLAINLTVALRDISHKTFMWIDWQRPLGDVALFPGMHERRVLGDLLQHGDDVDEDLFADTLTEYLPDVRLLPGAVDPRTAHRMGQTALS